VSETPENLRPEYVPAAWEEVACPFCGGTQARHHEWFGTKRRYEYVECRGCSLVYQKRRARYDEHFLSAAYHGYGDACPHVLNHGELNAEERALVESYRELVREIERALGRKGKILDIGCATGLFLLAAREEGWTPYGIDISSPMVKFMREVFHIPGQCGQYEEMDLTAAGPFDVLYCSHVIEHIPNPVGWVEKFRRDLAPDGLLLLNVPNQYSADRVVKRFAKRIGLGKDNWAPWRTPDHLYEPHFKPMKKLLEGRGFRIQDHYTYSRKNRDSFGQRIYQKKLRWGSNLRIFARPVKREGH
jgi:2-polyprenyl-3-methyl-5-hydroxy-6-metoxy-1,4-benzoquinol methylase